MKPKISVLVAARKNSKYLAKFLFGYFANTGDRKNTEILVMLNLQDTWNQELIDHFSLPPYNVKFFWENKKLGRAGLHLYFNDLLEHANGQWVIYFCEDHFIIQDGWDERIRQFITTRELFHKDVYCLIPKFDNAGAMNQILSRGYINALDGNLAHHGNLDSYINEVNGLAFGAAAFRPEGEGKPHDRILRFDDPAMFHDFTHDVPSPMSDAHLQTVNVGRGKKLPKYEDPIIRELAQKDADKLKVAIEGGR